MVLLEIHLRLELLLPRQLNNLATNVTPHLVKSDIMCIC